MHTRQSVSKYDIDTFEDLLRICNSGDDSPDVQRLRKIQRQLSRLNRLVGMGSLKQQLMYQILYYVQGLQCDDMMHTALMGPPGVGKTTVASVIAEIYKALGFLSEGKFITVTREDLVGQYLGETAIKTRAVLESCKGSVLFIDEAYSLGNDCSGDSYTKECVDTLVAFLSEHTKNFVCIIAGYERELRRHFFDSNPGLDRRFPWKHTLEGYKPEELATIFQRNVRGRWRLKRKREAHELLTTLISENRDIFCNNGGDMTVLLSACKMAHSRRVFGSKGKMDIREQDIVDGFEIFKKNRRGKDGSFAKVAHMYM